MVVRDLECKSRTLNDLIALVAKHLELERSARLQLADVSCRVDSRGFVCKLARDQPAAFYSDLDLIELEDFARQPRTERAA